MLPQASVQLSEALAPPGFAPGASECAWRVVAAVHPLSPLQINVRVLDADRRPIAILAGGNHALAPPDCRAMPVLRASGIRIDLEERIDSAETVRLPDTFMNLPADPLRHWQTPLLPLPQTVSAGSLHLTKPKGNALRVPRLPGARLGQARTGEITLSRVPLSRRSLEAPHGVPMSAAFAAEHQRLAETAGLPLADVTLLGVYPAIPIIAVRRLLVEDEGRLLRLWLKPESWWGRPAAHRIMLLVGRQASTGKMLQAAG